MSTSTPQGDRIISHRIVDHFAVEIGGKQYHVERDRQADGTRETWQVESAIRGGFDKEIVEFRWCNPDQKTHKRVVAWVKAKQKESPQ